MSKLTERLNLILERSDELNALNFRNKKGEWYAPSLFIKDAVDHIEQLEAEKETFLKLIPGVKALESRIKQLKAGVKEVQDLLINLQPKIPEACYPGHEKFIDNYVDVALEKTNAMLKDRS